MRKSFKIVFIILLVALIVIQFFQPEKNRSGNDSMHIRQTEKLPQNILTILESACFDCHSNNTKYQWYHKPAPVSWMISKHITNGKEELNFSDWGQFDIFDKITSLEEICTETKRQTMPLKSYTAIHRKAKLSDEQISELCAWTEKLSKEMLASIEE